MRKWLPVPGDSRRREADEDPETRAAVDAALGLVPPKGPTYKAKLFCLLLAGIGMLAVDGPRFMAFSVLTGALFFPQLGKPAYLPAMAVLEGGVVLTTLGLSAVPDPGFVLIFATYMATGAGKIAAVGTMSLAVFRTSTLSQFMALFEAFGVPKALTAASAVTLRFIPTMAEEYRSLGDSRRLRGLRVGLRGFLLNPVGHVEGIVVPLAFHSVRLAEELTASVISRGIGFRGERSVRASSPSDFPLGAWTALVLAGAVFLSRTGVP
ncbi:MAG: energy-coupling factor transporter transmembrane protein EcfT [Deltaproteobacteria bacterium]|nr:energy-coupling factor transporter transmembrane protein EcfT [Deltaproteobacteria bacterium]